MKMLPRFLCVVVLLAASLCSAAVKSIIDYYPDMVPAGGWTVKTNVGLPGGFPDTSGWTVVNPAVDTTGATNSSAAINAAIDSAGTSGTIIELPATPGGWLQLDNQLYFLVKKQILLRGAVDVDGNPTTFVKTAAGAAFVYVSGGARQDGATIVSGLTKGSTSITLSSGGGTPYSTGDIIRIDIANDVTIPVISVFGYVNSRSQLTRVTNKSSDTLTIFPALYDDYTIGASVNRYNGRSEWIGFENISCDMSASGQNGFTFAQGVYASWATNVNVQHSPFRNFVIQDCLQVQFRRCRADFTDVYPLANGAGFLIEAISGSLFEDCIVYEGFPGFEINSGCAGNVFAYLFCDRNGGKAIDTNHNSHNFMNLYEGCAVGTVQTDGYYGSVSKDSFWRCFVRGIDDGVGVAGFVPNRFTRDYGLFGNILGSEPVGVGNPNLGNGTYTGVITTDAWKDWGIGGAGLTGVLTTRTSDSVGTITFDAPAGGVGGIGQLSDGVNGDLVDWQSLGAHIVWSGGRRAGVQVVANTGVNVAARTVTFENWATTGDVLPAQDTAVTVWAGNAGFQELDQRAGTTLRLKGNYYIQPGGIPAPQTITPDTLANSVAYASETNSRPDWWDIGEFAFPPFDAAAPSPSNTNIPAGLRFLENTPPEHLSATIGTSGTVLTIDMNKPLTAGAGGTGGFTVSITGTGPATLNFLETSGSQVRYTIIRDTVITDEEVVQVAYAQPGNGWEDSNGNDLPSFGLFPVTNLSGTTSGAEYQYTTHPDNLDTEYAYDLSGDIDNIYPMTYTKSGNVVALALRVGTVAPATNGGIKVAIYNSSLGLVANGTGTFTAASSDTFVSVTLDSAAYVVAGQQYYMSYKMNTDDTPDVWFETGLASGSSHYRSGPSYISWPPATVTLQFANTALASVRSRLIPDVSTPDYTVGRLRFMRR